MINRSRNMREKLPLSQKISRFRLRMSDHEWRRYGMLLLVGKLVGIALVLAVAGLLPALMGGKVFAQSTP